MPKIRDVNDKIEGARIIVQKVLRAGQGWHRALRELLQAAQSNVLICSPFVGVGGASFLSENLPKTVQNRGRLTFLTNLSRGNMCGLANDPLAIRSLVHEIEKTTLHHIPGLHAKAYICDDTRAIVTSGNLTSGGLYRNLEYGVVISDKRIVQDIRADLSDFARLGAIVPCDDTVP
jgi:phosphatidylserine/phosphatidylglycerophosphate/cardiolipin synthase-like enzyme